MLLRVASTVLIIFYNDSWHTEQLSPFSCNEPVVSNLRGAVAACLHSCQNRTCDRSCSPRISSLLGLSLWGSLHSWRLFSFSGTLLGLKRFSLRDLNESEKNVPFNVGLRSPGEAAESGPLRRTRPTRPAGSSWAKSLNSNLMKQKVPFNLLKKKPYLITFYPFDVLFVLCCWKPPFSQEHLQSDAFITADMLSYYLWILKVDPQKFKACSREAFSEMNGCSHSSPCLRRWSGCNGRTWR